MKRRLTLVSALLLAAVLSGCAKSGTSSPPSEPERSMPVEISESSVASSQQSSPDVSAPDYDISAGKYKRTATGTRYFEGEGMPFTSTEIFDEYDNRVLWDDGYFVNTYTYEYNSDGLVTKRAYGSSNTCITYEYAGSLLVKECLYEDGKLNKTKTFEYNEHGDEMRTTVENASTGEVKPGPLAEYEYGENGKWITRKYYKNGTGELDSTETQSYDEKDNVTSYTLKYDNNKITEEYKYDDRGNKTEERRLEVRNGATYSDRRSVRVYDMKNREVKYDGYITENGTETLFEHIEYEYADL